MNVLNKKEMKLVVGGALPHLSSAQMNHFIFLLDQANPTIIKDFGKIVEHFYQKSTKNNNDKVIEAIFELLKKHTG